MTTRAGTGNPSVGDETGSRHGPATGAHYAVYRGHLLVGVTDLELAVEDGARAAGRFHPTPAFAPLRAVFALYHRAVGLHDKRLLRAYVLHRDSLGLQLWQGGTPLDATIELVSSMHRGPSVVHVATRDPRFWRDRGHASRLTAE